MEEARRLELRDSYLDHLRVFLKVSNSDSSLFGTLIDSWYAYHRGGVFVKWTGNPRTLTNPTGEAEKEAMRQLPFISHGAGLILFEGQSGRLVREHTIPKAHLCKMMTRDRAGLDSRSNIQAYLERYYHVAALTPVEHASLAQFNESMPFGWDEVDCLARYVGIPPYTPPRNS